MDIFDEVYKNNKLSVDILNDESCVLIINLFNVLTAKKYEIKRRGQEYGREENGVQQRRDAGLDGTFFGYHEYQRGEDQAGEYLRKGKERCSDDRDT